MRLIALIFLSFTFLCQHGYADTHAAATCENKTGELTVQAAVDASADGDMVTIPAGTCNWDTTVSWLNKNIRLVGAGEGVTVINVPSTGISVLTDTKANFRISGMTINMTANGYGIRIANNTHTPVGGTYSAGWRLDHLTITANNLTSVRAIIVFGLTYGLLDHVIYSSNYNTSQFLTHYAYTNDNSEADGQPFNQGAISWGLNHSLGDANAIYVEDCSVTATGTMGWAADVWYGGEVVFRYSTLTKQQISTHGARGTARGGKRMEVYGNSMTAGNDSRVVWWRSGTGVVFDNTLGSESSISVDNQRTCCNMSTRCDGNATDYDGNTAGEYGWPCLDQAGRGYGAPKSQTSVPIYAWNNNAGAKTITLGTDQVDDYCGTGNLCQTTSPPLFTTHIKTTGSEHTGGVVDYVNNGTTPKAGYTPYGDYSSTLDRYYHPLRGEDVTAPSVTAFVIPAASSSLTVPITTFTISDGEYCIQPTNSSTGCTWYASAPTTYPFGTQGAKTLYAFAKDAAGNISTNTATNEVDTDGVTITLVSGATVTYTSGSNAVRGAGSNAVRQ